MILSQPVMNSKYDYLNAEKAKLKQMSKKHESTLSEAIQQTKEISHFIDKRLAAGENSDTFRVLHALFNIYQNEVSLNTSLRQLVTKEKEKTTNNQSLYSSLRFEVNNFFDQINRISPKKLTSFDQIVGYLKRPVSDHIVHSQKKYKMKYKNLKIEHEKSKRETEKVKKELRNLKQELEQVRAQNVMDLAANNASIEREKEQTLFFQRRCIQLEATLSKYDEESNMISNNKQKEVQDAQNQIEQIRIQSMYEIQKYKEKNSKLRYQIMELTKQNEMLNNEFPNINQMKDEIKYLKEQIKITSNELIRHSNDKSKLESKLNNLSSKVSEVQKVANSYQNSNSPTHRNPDQNSQQNQSYNHNQNYNQHSYQNFNETKNQNIQHYPRTKINKNDDSSHNISDSRESLKSQKSSHVHRNSRPSSNSHSNSNLKRLSESSKNSYPSFDFESSSVKSSKHAVYSDSASKSDSHNKSNSDDEHSSVNQIAKSAMSIISKNHDVSFDLQSEISALQHEIASIEDDIALPQQRTMYP
ncbi:hypothetical protein TRFO_01212 [Tritrichomonas foetus]|uniref:Uncharacterized protein n=1 Tax=Tritrichomonas foetus TaxID=1144522 RepID=A0A1J4KNG6_9EUKA|nr:hypothetical protein TRFO_01212 [Tritrichomonas foetus]|eukprot:OHT11246.1 hypothetical protein TRFO_01212 [Tritrichomonas foetus]